MSINLTAVAQRVQRTDMYYFQGDKERLYPAFGIDKIIWMNQLRPIHHSEQNARFAKAVKDFSNFLGNYKEKEGDWAIMGGLAQGIGGLGAGIAAAAQTQINNMEIRQRNAQRQQQAALISSSLDVYMRSAPGFPAEALLTGEEICQLQIRTVESTAELFGMLHVQVDIPKKSREERSKGLNPISYKFTDFGGNEHVGVKVNFTTKHTRRIDGYLRMIMRNEQETERWEQIIPLPLLGVGTTGNSVLSIPLPARVTSVVFEPIALWEIVDDSCPDAAPVSTLAEASQGLQRAWKANEQKHSEHVSQMARSELLRRVGIVGGVAVVVAFIIGIFAMITINQNNEHAFEMGSIVVISEPAEAHEDYYSKLPESYHQRVADKYLQYVSDDEDYDRAKAHLEYASLYATPAQQETILHKRIQAMINSNEAGLARAEVQKAYEAGKLTVQQVVDYAKSMYSFEGYSYWKQTSNMQDDAVQLLALVKDQHDEAAALHDEWYAMRSGYSDAVASFHARDYAAAYDFFKNDTVGKYAEEYHALSKAMMLMLGTWTDARGNKLVIDENLDKPIGMIDDQPWRIYINMTYNGRDISSFWSEQYKQTRYSYMHMDFQRIQVEYDGSFDTEYYHVDVDEAEGTIELAYGAKKPYQWTTVLHKTAE